MVKNMLKILNNVWLLFFYRIIAPILLVITLFLDVQFMYIPMIVILSPILLLAFGAMVYIGWHEIRENRIF